VILENNHDLEKGRKYKMFKHMKLGTKLLLAFLAVGVIPLAIVGLVTLNRASNSISQLAFNQLDSMRAIKTAQIDKFFAERQGDMGVLMETVGSLRQEAFNKLETVQELKTTSMEQYFKNLRTQLRTQPIIFAVKGWPRELGCPRWLKVSAICASVWSAANRRISSIRSGGYRSRS